MTAVPSKIKSRAYVTGVVKALHKVEESMDETPFVARAVYPPIAALA
jgi:hypothetical protein